MNEQPITKQNLTKTKLNLNEIFYSIQGEGPWQGYPALFIRLAGCNLQCTWCDTDYSTQLTLSEEEIYNEIISREANTGRVVITGGEPFAQNITPLVDLLWKNGFAVQIETNGMLSIPSFPFGKVTLVCSPKAGKIHADIKSHCKDYKYVIGAEDVLNGVLAFPCSPTQACGKRPPPQATWNKRLSFNIWVMPRDDKNKEVNSSNMDAAVTIAKRFNYRLCLQQQKVLSIR